MRAEQAPGGAEASESRLIVAGTITLDWVEGTAKPAEAAIGGSAIYAAAAAVSVGMPVTVVGVVGTDYPVDRLHFLEERGADLSGIRVEQGRSFRWRARYDGEDRETLHADRGISGSVDPTVPEERASAGWSLLLGSTDPSLQRSVLDQTSKTAWVGLDTMMHWIRDRRTEVLDLAAQADILFLTAAEARLLAGHTSIPRAVELLLERGPRAVVVKRGSRGAWLMDEDGGAVAVPAVAVPEVRDPTGAGDAFAGAFMAVLEMRGDDVGLVDFRDALRHASAVASFAVEQVSIEGFDGLSTAELRTRLEGLGPVADPAGNVEEDPDVLNFPGSDDPPS